MHPHVDEILLDFFDLLITADFHGYLRKCYGRIDGLTDRLTYRPYYGDARRHLVSLISLLGHLFVKKK